MAGSDLRALDGALPFTHRVPYRLLLPPGPGGPAPLLVALHGKGDAPARFEAEALDALPAGWALLLPSAPIPRDRSPGRREGGVGASWYVYDGDTPRFRESLAEADRFVLRLLARVRRGARGRPAGTRAPDLRRVALLGFSQGAYLAGVLAVRHPRVFRAAVLVGGRLKHEMLGGGFRRARALRLLGLHGSRDPAVRPAPSRESMAAAREAGLGAEFREFDAAHEFTPSMRAAARAWLRSL